jgi:hypothetical protein
MLGVIPVFCRSHVDIPLSNGRQNAPLSHAGAFLLSISYLLYQVLSFKAVSPIQLGSPLSATIQRAVPLPPTITLLRFELVCIVAFARGSLFSLSR